MASSPDSHAITDPSLQDLFHTLGRSLCWEVLSTLMRVSAQTSWVADELSLEPSQVSLCLRRLHEIGLVECKQRKKSHFYHLGKRAEIAVDDDQLCLYLVWKDSVRLRLSPMSESEESAPLIHVEQRSNGAMYPSERHR